MAHAAVPVRHRVVSGAPPSLVGAVEWESRRVGGWQSRRVGEQEV